MSKIEDLEDTISNLESLVDDLTIELYRLKKAIKENKREDNYKPVPMTESFVKFKDS